MRGALLAELRLQACAQADARALFLMKHLPERNPEERSGVFCILPDSSKSQIMDLMCIAIDNTLKYNTITVESIFGAVT